MAFAIIPVTSFTVVAIRDMAGAYLDPLVVLQALLTVELDLTADTLQASALITLICSLFRATTGITLLTY